MPQQLVQSAARCRVIFDHMPKRIFNLTFLVAFLDATSHIAEIVAQIQTDNNLLRLQLKCIANQHAVLQRTIATNTHVVDRLTGLLSQ